MLWVFSAAGLMGVLCGCLFRAPAIMLLSFIGFACGFVALAPVASSPGEAFLYAFLLTATMQLGYLLGLGFSLIGRRLLARIADGPERFRITKPFHPSGPDRFAERWPNGEGVPARRYP
jgi:hypothetical protein